MKSDDWSIAKAKLTAYLQRQNLRMIPKRFAVLEKICSYDGHFSIDSLYAYIRESGENISRATVYNTVSLLLEAGLVQKHQIMDGRVLYEQATKRKHCHCVCIKCGKIREFSDDVLQTAIRSKRVPTFEQTSFSLCIYGICRACRQKEEFNNKKYKSIK